MEMCKEDAVARVLKLEYDEPIAALLPADQLGVLAALIPLFWPL
jgi:hypothetical protein